MTLPLIKLYKSGKAVHGIMPDGRTVVWAEYLSNKPTKRNKRVMVNCSYYTVEWLDKKP